MSDGGAVRLEGAERADPWARGLLGLFLVALLFPIFINLGPLRLSPYRLVLLAGFLPLVAAWLLGRAGRIRALDLIFLGYCLWCTVGFLRHHGLAAAEAGGILIIETFGAYLLARVAIRSVEDMLFFVRMFCAVILVMGLFAMIESVTRVLVLDELFGRLFRLRHVVYEEERLGLRRAQGPLDHPILYGVFCSMAFALSWYVLRWRDGRQPRATIWPAVVAWAAFWSLSAGAWLAVLLQGALIGWDRVLKRVRGRWWILLALFAGLYLFLELASNRGAVRLALATLTFNHHNAAYRLLIWEYAWPETTRLWLFGGGLDYDWRRGPGMGATIDTLYLVVGVRSGLVALMILVAGLLTAVLTLVRLPLSGDPRLDDIRKALLFVLLGLILAMFTVHLWNGTYAMLFVLLGAGGWLADRPAGRAGGLPVPPSPPPRRTVLDGGGTGQAVPPRGRTVL